MSRSTSRSIVVLGCLLLVVLATHSASARDESLRGNRIVLFDPSDLFIPASEPSFVKHGWSFPMEDVEIAPGVIDPGWTNLSAEERQERFDDAVWRFELFVDGVPVALQRTFHSSQGGDPHSMDKWFFVQFEAGQFSAGQIVQFEGHWYGDTDDDDVGELEVIFARTVVFT